MKGMPSRWDTVGYFNEMGPWHGLLCGPETTGRPPGMAHAHMAIRSSSTWPKAKSTWRENFQNDFLKTHNPCPFPLFLIPTQKVQ